MNIDQIVERARAKDVEALYVPAADTGLADFIGGMDAKEFDMDAADILLGYMNVPMSTIQEAIADAADELENYPGQESSHFTARAKQLMHAVISSARNYKEIVE
jgi:hypothetical protein